MKTANKSKTESIPPKAKAVKGGRRSTRKSAPSNGKHPLATYQHAPIGIVEASLDGRHINVNEEFCRIVGYQKEELLGKPIKNLTHEEDYPIDVKLHEQLVEGKIPFYRFEKRYLRKDGSHIWVELTRSIVRDEEGNPLYTIGVVLDISERKHVERVLRESVERLRLATEAARMFTWEWDFQNQSYTLSDSFTQVLGFPTDLLSKNSIETLARFIPAEDLQATTEAFVKAVESQKDLHSLQCRVINAASGQVVWLEISAKIVYDYEGKPERMFGVAQNITEDKQKEEALSESEERFRALISQATAGIAQSDLKSRLTFVNPRFCEMLGYSASELLGKTIWELTYTDELAENKRLFKRLLEQGESYHFEKRFLRKDGTPLWTSISVSAIRDRMGKPKGGVGVMVDIQERKQAEEALSEFARQQEALYKLSDQLHRTESLEDVFNAALDAILRALQCDRASILLFDDTDVMRFVAWRELSDAYRKTTEGHSPWKVDAKNPEPLSIDDIKTSDLSEELKAVIEGEGIRSLAFIPLVSNGKLIGKFMVYFNSPHAFGGGELDLCLTIAHQLAFGIDHKRAEANVRQSEERFRQAANASGALVYEVNLTSGTTAIVYGMETLAGYDPQEIAASSDWWHSVIHPEDLAAHLTQLDELLKSGGTDVSEYRLLHKNGEWIIVQDNRLVIQDEAGQPVRLVGAVIDITQRKKAEEALRDSEQRYRFIVENTSDGIWGIELTEPMPISLSEDEQIEWYYNHAIIRQCNLGLANMYGYDSVEDVIGLPLRVVMPREDPLNLELSRQFVRSGYRLVDSESREVDKDGRELVFLNNMIGIIEDGKLKGEWGTNRDITERKRMEEALRVENERFMRFVNSNIVGILIGNADGDVILANDYYLRLLGVTREDFMNGKVDWKKFTPPEWLPADEKAIRELHERGVCEPYEKEYVRTDGTRIPVYVADALLSGPGEEIAAFVLDISERKRAEEALRRNEQMFSTLVDAAPFGVYFIDSEFRLRAINKGSEAVFSGISPLIGRDFAEILRIVWKEPFATETIERFRHTLRTGESFLSPPVIEKRANIDEIQAYDWQIHRITLSDGTYGVVCYFYDLSEQKKMEASVRASETLYRTIARSIPGGGVYVVDKDFRYLIAEGPVTEAFGLSREMLEGHTVSEVFPDERGARMEDRLRRNFAGETVGFETELNERVYWTQQAPLMDSIGQAIILTLDITERKRAEEALRQSEERFALFMQHLPGLAWIKDTQGRYVYANAAAEKAFSTPRENLYGKTDEEIFPPKIAAQFKKNDQRALTEEQGVQVIETLEQADGVLHSSLVSKFPIPGPDGSQTLIGGTAFDITERLQAEEALRESEERFSAILRQATAGIVRKDSDGRLIFVNQAFCNMLGYTEEELVGKTIWEFMHPDDIVENKRSYVRLMAEGIPFKLERRFLREDGSVIWVDASVSPIMDAEGKPQSAVAVEVDITARSLAEEALRELNLQLEDRVLSRTAKLRAVNQTLREEITERKRVEEALRQSETTARTNQEKLQTLFDLLPVGISFLNPQGQIIQMNSALSNILKLPKEQLLGQAYTSRIYIRADGMSMSPDEFASTRALMEGKTIYNVETGVLLESGEVVWTNVSAAPVDVAEVGAVVVTVDITDSKRAERALKESHRRLRILSQRLVEVQEEERRALARELHDRVGQTLAALNINLIIVNSQLSSEESEQIGTRLNDSMKLVSETIALVRDVMTDLRPSILDDYGLEAALESHLAQFISRYNISARLEKPAQPLPRVGPSVEMTFLRIAQEALMNIARHAKASEVRLSLQQDGDMICLTIQDNGIGIESWQHANRPGSHGLTIMRERAEAFDGTLQVKSIPGEGTIVEVNIPFREESAAGSREKKNP